MAFRPMVNRTQNTRKDRFKIVNPESGFEFIEPFLRESKGWTTFRMLPSFSPDTGEEEEQISETGEMGCAFYPLEVCSLWQNGRVMFTSTIQPEDENGRKVTFRQTPAGWMMKRLGYKIYEQNEKKNRKLPTDIPPYWMTWKQSGVVSNTQQMYLLQGMAKEVNGVARTDMNRRPIWIKPALFAIPKSAETAFLGRITAAEDETQPLSVENNRFGDFCTCANGRNLRLVRYEKEDKKGGKKIEYALELENKPNPVDPDEARELVRPWEEILYIPTVEQAIAHLLEIFEEEAVDFGLRNTGYYNYLPEKVKGKASRISEAEDVKSLQAAVPEPVKTVSVQVQQPEPVQQAPLQRPAVKPAFRPSQASVQTAQPPIRRPVVQELEPVQDEAEDAAEGDVDGNVQEVEDIPQQEIPSATDRKRFASTLSALSRKVQK